MELVSVVITTCNRTPDIVKIAIDSVLNQTYPNVQLIVVNDSPNFKYRSELEEMINGYEGRVIYLVNEAQKGANYARNLGAKKSDGTILSFLDDDDYWHINRLEKIVMKIDEGCDVVYSDYVIFSEKGSRINSRFLPKDDEKLERILAGNFLGGFSNVTFTKKLFEKVGMLDESMPSYQDQDLFIRLVQHGRLGYINEGLSYYRITPVSISLNENKKFTGMKMLLEKYEHLFNKYPEAKRRRLESELIYARKQGWSENATAIKNYLKEYDSYLRIFRIDFNGFLKYIAIKYLKLQ